MLILYSVGRKSSILKEINSGKDTLREKKDTKINNIKKNQFPEKLLSLSVDVPRAENNFRATRKDLVAENVLKQRK